MKGGSTVNPAGDRGCWSIHSKGQCLGSAELYGTGPPGLGEKADEDGLYGTGMLDFCEWGDCGGTCMGVCKQYTNFRSETRDCSSIKDENGCARHSGKFVRFEDRVWCGDDPKKSGSCCVNPTAPDDSCVYYEGHKGQHKNMKCENPYAADNYCSSSLEACMECNKGQNTGDTLFICEWHDGKCKDPKGWKG